MTDCSKSNIVLIGMPGAGKSTIGPLLSERLAKDFADLDDIIRQKQGRELRDIVLEYGYEHFLRVQEQVILALGFENHVLATGGSVVMSPLSMVYLKHKGTIVYLSLSFETFEKRLGPGRRLARSGDQSMREVYDERTPLYRNYADIVIDCDGKSIDDIVNEILLKVS